jgi:TP901 family phage tail tape measure protein
MPFMGGAGGAIGGALTLKAVITLANKQFLRSIDEVDARTKRMVKRWQGMSRIFAAGALAITIALAASVGVAADFEQSMANMDSVAHTTRAEFKMLEDQALSLGTTSVYAAREVADAMYWLASAGQRAHDIAQTLPGVLTLAAATGHDLAATTETVVSVLSAFRYGAEQTDRVVNSMAATIGSSLANMHKMTEAMKYAAPVAKSIGHEIEELNAVLGLFFNAGLEGSRAGTAYRLVLLSLVKPSEDFTKILDAMGFAVEDVNPQLNKMADIIDTLNDAYFDAGDVVQSFGRRGATSMLYLLLVGGDALRQMEEQVTGTTAAQDMMRRQMDSLASQTKVLKNALAAAGITLGKVLLPVMRDLVDWALRGVAAISLMSPSMAEATVKSLALAAGLLGILSVVGRLAPVLLGATGPLALLATGVVGIGIAHELATGKLEDYISQLDGASEAEKKSLESKIQWQLFWATMTDWKTYARSIAAGGDAAALAMAVVTTGTENLLDAMFAGTEKAESIIDSWSETYKSVMEEAAAASQLMIDKMRLADLLAEQAEARNQRQEERRKKSSDALKRAAKAEIDAMNAKTAAAIAASNTMDELRAQEQKEMEFAKDGFVHVMDAMAVSMQESVDATGPILKQLVMSALTAMADVVEGHVRTAMTNVLLAQAESLGILSIQGFFDPTSWAKILPMMLKAAAAIAAIKVIRSKLSFHSGGKPPGEGYYWVRDDEHVIDPHKARRGGYGASYQDTLPVGGGIGGITIQIGNITITDPEIDVDKLVRRIGMRVEGELARAGA